jgi:hypothetical protein
MEAAALHHEQGHYDEKKKQFSQRSLLVFLLPTQIAEDYTGGG